MTEKKDAPSSAEEERRKNLDIMRIQAGKERFRAAAARQKIFLAKIAAADHAPPELHKLKMHIAELRCQVQDASEHAATLRARMAAEKAEYEAVEQSRVRRLAYVLGGQRRKHDAKVEREQREYLEVLGEYEMAAAQLAELERMFEAAKKERTKLEELIEGQVELKNLVEEMANCVFDGPSPEFPKDDEAEEELKQAQTKYEELQATYFSEKQTVDALTKARGLALSALAQVRYAIQQARIDIMVPDSMQNNHTSPFEVDWEAVAGQRIDRALRKAQEEVAEATVIANTTLADVGLTGVETVKIPERHIVWNILLDSMLTDIIFREKLKDVEVEVEEFCGSLSAALEMFLPRHESLKEQTYHYHGELIAKRQQLVDARMKILEQILEEDKS